VTVLPWWGVFLPLILETGFLSILLITGCKLKKKKKNFFNFFFSPSLSGCGEGFISSGKWLDRVMSLVLLLITCLFFIFFALRLDEIIQWSWFQILVPVFLLKVSGKKKKKKI
jgi:hypothetical protein